MRRWALALSIIYVEKENEVQKEENNEEFVSWYDNPKINDKYSEYDIPDKQYDWDFLKEIGVENPE